MGLELDAVRIDPKAILPDAEDHRLRAEFLRLRKPQQRETLWMDMFDRQLDRLKAARNDPSRNCTKRADNKRKLQFVAEELVDAFISRGKKNG